MNAFGYGAITRGALQYRLERELPRNHDRRDGFALIFVHNAEAFAQGRIPLSINIPRGREHLLGRRFAPTKEIVLYGEGNGCVAAMAMASALLNLGFVRIYVYEGGMCDWRNAGYPVESEYGSDRSEELRNAPVVESGKSDAGRSAARQSAKSTTGRRNYQIRPAAGREAY